MKRVMESFLREAEAFKRKAEWVLQKAEGLRITIHEDFLALYVIVSQITKSMSVLNILLQLTIEILHCSDSYFSLMQPLKALLNPLNVIKK